MEQNKFTIRTSGFYLYFLLCVMAMMGFGLYIIIQEGFQKGFSIVSVWGIVFVGWAEIYLYLLVAHQKIEIQIRIEKTKHTSYN